MTESIKEAVTTIDQLTSARSVQALITVIVTIALMAMFLLERTIPEPMIYAWFALLGLYMEMPGKPKQNG